MKRIWLKAKFVEFFNWGRSKGLSNSNKWRVWLDMRVGNAFNVNGIILEESTSNKFGLSQFSSMSNVRILSTPLSYKGCGKRVPRLLLDDILALAVFRNCMIPCKDVIVQFMQNGKFKPPVRKCKPALWKGKALEIPVEFIRIGKFERIKDKGVSAHIRVGHHLVFWNVKIFDLSGNPMADFSPYGILDRRVSKIISEMLENPKLKDVVKNVSWIDDSMFVRKVKGCNLDGAPPPIRFR